MEVKGEKWDVNDLANFYEGVLLDEPESSRVTGSISEGVFHGTIDSKKHGRFFIESAKRFNRSSKAHSIIYHEDDVSLDKSRIRKRSIKDHSLEDDQIGCGSGHDIIKKEMERIQKELYAERRRIEV